MPFVGGIPDFDKVIHAGLYGGEGLLIYFAVRWPGRPGFSALRVLAIVGAMAVFGSLDEVHQTWIPGRFCDPQDVMADVIGGSAGAVIASTWTGRRKARVKARRIDESRRA